MQRVRMSLPYFAEYGWVAEVVMVDERYTDIAQDALLLQSVPVHIKMHKVAAFSKKNTAKIGLGSLSIRSLWFYKRYVDKLLRREKFDLIYFSTTQFPVCILGAYWKKRFGVPYVIDMQDPWHSPYYGDKPKNQRPPKYWFSYRLNKYLEPIAMKHTDGLISVSGAYIDQFKLRYPSIKKVPALVITFGAFAPDLQIAKDNSMLFERLLSSQFTNIVYIGRGGNDMHTAIRPVFEAFRRSLDLQPERFSKVRFHFIGTSYAPAGQGKATILPLAKQLGIENYVSETTERISYYHTLLTLQQADALFIPGSDDPQYTASKIFPYLLTAKPVLAVFNKASSAIPIIQEYGVQHVYSYDEVSEADLLVFFDQLIGDGFNHIAYNADAVKKHSAVEMTRAQCHLFDQTINAGH